MPLVLWQGQLPDFYLGFPCSHFFKDTLFSQKAIPKLAPIGATPCITYSGNMANKNAQAIRS